MRTVVTGAGLIGSEFARCALARGDQVVFIDAEPRGEFLRQKLGHDGYTHVQADIRDLPTLVATIRKHEATTVVHTAGLIGGRVQQSLSQGFDINLGGARNIAEAVRLTGVRRLVHISTFGVYDLRRTPTASINEDFPRGGARGYGNFKAAQELILEAYAALYAFELIMLRPANVFGFGHFWAGSSGGAKMQELLQAGREGRTARIASAETMANEYVYGKDVGRAVDLAATVKMPAVNTFNIGTGVISPFSDVIAAARAVCPRLAYEVMPGASPRSKDIPLDITRAREHLGWEPQYDLRSGFADFLAEFGANA